MVSQPGSSVCVGCGGFFDECGVERAVGKVDELAGAVKGEQLRRASGELAADFAAAAFFAGNNHVIVAGGLMAHPSDGRGFGALLDRDASGAGDGAAADGCGVGGDACGHGGGVVAVVSVKRQEGEHGAAEIFGVSFLVGGAASAGGVEFPLIGGVLAFECEFRPERGDTAGGCPYAMGEAFAAFGFDHGPRGAVGLDATTECGVAGRKKIPAVGHDEDFTVETQDLTRQAEGADFERRRRHAGEGRGPARRHKPGALKKARAVRPGLWRT